MLLKLCVFICSNTYCASLDAVTRFLLDSLRNIELIVEDKAAIIVTNKIETPNINSINENPLRVNFIIFLFCIFILPLKN